jgi:hypothetical protein
MRLILSRPFDDKDIIDPYMVSHDVIPLSEFEGYWNEAVKEAKRSAPEDWMVNDVIDLLRTQGWQIIFVDSITVTY